MKQLIQSMTSLSYCTYEIRIYGVAHKKFLLKEQAAHQSIGVFRAGADCINKCC